MHSNLLIWTETAGWTATRTAAQAPAGAAQLVLAFGTRDWFADPAPLAQLRALHPGADVLGCSTGGQIAQDDVTDAAAIALVLTFDRARVRVAQVDVRDHDSARAAGQTLAQSLVAPDLRTMIVLSDGLHVNATQLVEGMRSVTDVPITGGLAGDGPHFEQTRVHLNGRSGDHLIVAAALYGDSLRIGHGSSGGWTEFGPRRLITGSSGNVLLSLDGRSALDLYRTYLGEEAAGLPGTGLLYPLMITDPANPGRQLVRTLLSVDETSGAMIFAGDMPEGWQAQLMRGYFDRLARAAGEAAGSAIDGIADRSGDCAALMISCIGRRILMADSVITELLTAREEFGPDVLTAGFYSYGEIAPGGPSGQVELHNQTMTVTLLAEGP